MGTSKSNLARLQSQGADDEITTVSERLECVDPILEKLKSLEIATPMLTGLPTETSLTDILMKKHSSSSYSVNPKVLLDLFSVYHDWQEAKAQKISKKQEEIENKIEVADALAVKILQRFNYSVSTMRTTSHHLTQIPLLQVELGELKGRLTEVISNCDALCRRIAAEGPKSLRSSVKPFSATSADLETSSSLPSPEEALKTSPSPTEAKVNEDRDEESVS